jgi:hypothetical protein
MRSKKKEELHYTENDYSVMNIIIKFKDVAEGNLILKCPLCNGEIKIKEIKSQINMGFMLQRENAVYIEGICKECKCDIKISKGIV